MHARPRVREHLLARSMQKWALIGRHPSAFPNCPASRARRNFSRLLARYPQIAKNLGLTALCIPTAIVTVVAPNMDNTKTPEVLAVIPLPLPGERTRRSAWAGAAVGEILSESAR
jgi:hypothetical protein